MAKRKNKERGNKNIQGCCNMGGATYMLGAVGSAVYYISNAGGFWIGVLGVLKALVWPAFLVYHAFRYLVGM